MHITTKSWNCLARPKASFPQPVQQHTCGAQYFWAGASAVCRLWRMYFTWSSQVQRAMTTALWNHPEWIQVLSQQYFTNMLVGPSAFGPGLVGLCLSYVLPLTDLIGGLLTTSVETEQEMVSVERVLQYTGIPPQACLCSLPLAECRSKQWLSGCRQCM